MQNMQDKCCSLGSLSPSATLAISAKAKELKAQGVDVCSMTAGEPDFDTPEVIKEACIHAIKEGKVRYLASSGLPELKAEIVKKFASNGIMTEPQNVIISTGAKFAIFQAITCLCAPEDEVIVFAPYWLSYAEMIKAAGAKMVLVQTHAQDGYQPRQEDLLKAITPKTKLIIVNTPNNPTGAVYSLETLKMIAEIAVRAQVMVLSDEIYEKLIYDEAVKHISIASLTPEIAALTITVNGFSKAYAMTGWRLGYLTAPEWLTKRIAALQSHATSNATSFVQYAALAALQGKADAEVQAMISAFGKRRELLCGRLDGLEKIDYFKPLGAFYVICDIRKTGLKAEEFAVRILEKEKLAVIPCTPFGAENCIRLSYACSEDNIIEAVARLQRFVKEL